MFAQVELDRDYDTALRPRPSAVPLPGARLCRHEDCERLEENIREDVLRRCVDEGAAKVRIPVRGGYILAQPLNTRRFVRAMARHISFN
jgi:hypothetical protein